MHQPHAERAIQPVKAKEIQPYTAKTSDTTKQQSPKSAPDRGEATSPAAFVGT